MKKLVLVLSLSLLLSICKSQIVLSKIKEPILRVGSVQYSMEMIVYDDSLSSTPAIIHYLIKNGVPDSSWEINVDSMRAIKILGKLFVIANSTESDLYNQREQLYNLVNLANQVINGRKPKSVWLKEIKKHRK